MKDDIDDIFRNAATNYPLNTDGANWDAVMQRLQQPGAITPLPAKQRNKNSRGFLFLLLPLAFIYHLPRYESANTIDNPISLGDVPAPIIMNENALPYTSINKAIALPGTGLTDIKKNKEHILTKATLLHSSPYSFYRDKIDKASTYLRKTERVTTDNSYNSTEGNIGVILTGTNDTSQALNDNVRVKEENVKEEKNALDSVQISVTSLDSTALVVAEQIGNDKNTKKNKRWKGFYAGVVVSPDFSTVKMQQVQKLGYGAGILVGYRISKRWAIETGALWEKKYYYSKGEYFNTGKLNLPSNTVINKVNGWCNMIDVPLTVRYFFSTGKKHIWSANASLLSYIMNRENYTYQYTRYGNPYERGYEYKSDTRNWFSVMQLGLGYEHNAGRWGLIRIEPYIRVPLGGIGVGSLPVSSAGLNIGIMKPIR